MAKGDSGGSSSATNSNSSLTNYSGGSPFMRSRLPRQPMNNPQPMNSPIAQAPADNNMYQQGANNDAYQQDPNNGAYGQIGSYGSIGPSIGMPGQPNQNYLNTAQPVSIAPYFADTNTNFNQAQPVANMPMDGNITGNTPIDLSSQGSSFMAPRNWQDMLRTLMSR